jgi:hypothetical protein
LWIPKKNTFLRSRLQLSFIHMSICGTTPWNWNNRPADHTSSGVLHSIEVVGDRFTKRHAVLTASAQNSLPKPALESILLALSSSVLFILSATNTLFLWSVDWLPSCAEQSRENKGKLVVSQQ